MSYQITIYTMEGTKLVFLTSDTIKLYRKGKEVHAINLIVGDYIEHDGKCFRVKKIER